MVALLAEAGAIDDASFARRYAEDKRRLAGWGPDRISRALEARGLAREEIEAALAGDDEVALVERAGRVIAERGLACDTERDRERALSLLVRRGFPLELAYDAVRAASRRADAA